MRFKKGFTLIEMLVVIAIIAVLISIIIPTTAAAIAKASATVDAANLRSVMGQLNGVLINADKMSAQQAQGLQAPPSKTYPNARLLVVYQNPGFIDAYYMLDGNYYGLEYFKEIAETGSTNIEPQKPTGDRYEWYEAGVGKFEG